MEVRFARPADIPTILELLLQVGDVHHRGRPDLFRAGAQKYGEQAMLDMLADANRPVFVAVEDDRVLGYGMCVRKVYRGDPAMTDRTELYIDDICVDEAARGRHVGTAVYRHVVDYARETGCHNITLNAWCCNPGAIKFYEACGMKPQKIGMETVLEDADAGKG